MTKKSQPVVPRMPDENPPAYLCNECWFYEPDQPDHGACYGVPPTPLLDKDGDVMHPRSIVFATDRGCALWKSRHGTH